MRIIPFVCLLGGLLLTGCRPSKEERFAKEAAMLNRQCPQQQNDCTLLEEVTYRPQDSVFQYRYALSGADDEVLAARLREPETAGRLRLEICNSVELKACKEYGITFVFVYYSRRSGRLLGSLRVPPEAYR